MSDPKARANATPAVAGGKKMRVEITPLSQVAALPRRVGNINAFQATPQCSNELVDGFVRLQSLNYTCSSQSDVCAIELQLRKAAMATNDLLLVGLNAKPAFESASGLTPMSADGTSTRLSSLVSGAARGGIYQLTSFPVARFNGVSLPAGSSISFADPTRWLKGLMDSRLMTISVDKTNKFFAWDAHNPVGNTPHDYWHLNQKGMYAVVGQSNHAPLTGTALIQAKQLRYLKIGGRVFLVVGVVIDGIQLGSAAVASYEQKSVKPIAAQTVRTAGSWALAWAGAKAGVLAGGMAGIETGPGLVLTAIGGGIIGGVAGYLGADWVADFIYEN